MRSRSWAMRHRRLAIVATALAFGAMLPARSDAAICDASAFGCPATGQCTITGTWSVSDGCTIDFGDRTVELRGTLQAVSLGGSFAVRAGGSP